MKKISSIDVIRNSHHLNAKHDLELEMLNRHSAKSRADLRTDISNSTLKALRKIIRDKMASTEQTFSVDDVLDIIDAITAYAAIDDLNHYE